jgi:deoxyadenosine/deoxycytidine kinase
MKEFRYIAVDGLIKTGKTQLAEILASEFNGRLIIDNQENPFIAPFFRGISTGDHSSFLKTQLIFLLNRYSQQLEIKQKGLFHKTTICDYVFHRDGIYAHSILNDEELEVYKKMFQLFSESVSASDLVIYLQISFSEMLKRIQSKGNAMEKSVPKEYWREIYEAYNYYFFNFKSAPLLVVNMEKVDFNEPTDVRSLLNEIKNHRKGTRYYALA